MDVRPMLVSSGRRCTNLLSFSVIFVVRLTFNTNAGESTEH